MIKYKMFQNKLKSFAILESRTSINFNVICNT